MELLTALLVSIAAGVGAQLDADSVVPEASLSSLGGGGSALQATALLKVAAELTSGAEPGTRAAGFEAQDEATSWEHLVGHYATVVPVSEFTYGPFTAQIHNFAFIKIENVPDRQGKPQTIALRTAIEVDPDDEKDIWGRHYDILPSYNPDTGKSRSHGCLNWWTEPDTDTTKFGSVSTTGALDKDPACGRFKGTVLLQLFLGLSHLVGIKSVHVSDISYFSCEATQDPEDCKSTTTTTKELSTLPLLMAQDSPTFYQKVFGKTFHFVDASCPRLGQELAATHTAAKTIANNLKLIASKGPVCDALKEQAPYNPCASTSSLGCGTFLCSLSSTAFDKLQREIFDIRFKSMKDHDDQNRGRLKVANPLESCEKFKIILGP